MKNEKFKSKGKIAYWYKLFYIIFFIVIVFQPIAIIYNERETFFARGYEQQYESFKRAYSTSQYVQKEEPGIIPDQTLESFAGGAFLRGINPISIIHDQPPMGRYILSLSILLFDNPNTIIILLSLLSGLGVFFIGKLILKNTLLSFIPLAIIINEPLFINKFYNSPLLEPIQLPFIIFTIYFFILGIVKKDYVRWFIFTSIMLGFVISIRFFIVGLLLALTMIIYFLINKQFNKKFFAFLLSLPIAIVILLISYARTIQLGSSPFQIFGVQKYIYTYHKAQLSLPFSFWDLLLFNRWHTWWGAREISSDFQWIIIWPISTILSLIYFLAGIFKKVSISEPEKILIIWVIAYSLFLSLGETSTRYFSPLLPFIYIIATSFLVKMVL
ncbi:MAG: glycosyltransferase family 39 protein [Candidatus Levybacteria bacterium]|nr:glycosyltransferase family 39 protein [Candidatus Levybacteria bacterium]